MRSAEVEYRIPDEPSPSTLSRFAVNPFWPFLAMMLGGSWLGLPWFCFNAVALGSATRVREWVLAGLAPLAVVGLAVAYDAAAARWGAPPRADDYATVFLLGVKLSAGQVLCLWQGRTFALHEHFGGSSAKGAWAVVALGAYLKPRVIEAAVQASGYLWVACL